MKRCYQVLGFILTGGLVNISMAVSSPFDGFYVGGKMGVAVSDTREVDQIIDRKRIPASGATNGYHFNDNTGDQSPAVWAGSLFGGYGHALGQRFYVSVDGEWLLRNPRLNGSLDYRATVPFGPPFTQEYHEIANYDLSINGGYALSFNPGILLTPTTLLYFSFGYTGAKAHLIMEHTVRDFNVPTVNVDTEDQYLRGLRVGLGMQFYFRPHWSAGVEYLYTNYTSHNLYGEQYFLGTLLTRSVASYFSAHADMVSYLANVTYHFNGDNLPAIKMQVGDFEGFYVGLNLATLKGSLLDDTLRNTYLDQVGAFDQTDRIDSNVANYRIQPGLQLGYGWNLGDAFNVALAFRAQFGHFGSQNDYGFTNAYSNSAAPGLQLQPGQYQTTYAVQGGRSQSEYGLQIHLGYLLNPQVLSYIVLGANRMLFRTNGYLFNTMSSNRNNVTLPLTVQQHVYAFDIGLGFAVKVVEHWGVRLQYDYSSYGAPGIEGAGFAPQLFAPFVQAQDTTYSTVVHPRTESVSLGLTYYLSS